MFRILGLPVVGSPSFPHTRGDVLRTYELSGALTPRSKAQDIAGAFTASSSFTQINTTFNVDPHIQTVASDTSHARIEVQATLDAITNRLRKKKADRDAASTQPSKEEGRPV